MTITFYTIPGAVGLKFINTVDRDAFYNTLKPEVQAAVDKIATRTIRFYPDRIKTNFVLSMQTLPTQPAAAAPKPQPTPTQPKVTVAEPPKTTTTPFAIEGEVKRALPGLVHVVSNIPPEQMSEPVKAPEPDVPMPENNALPPTPANDDPEPTGIHKNSRQYREWKARQKG